MNNFRTVSLVSRQHKIIANLPVYEIGISHLIPKIKRAVSSEFNINFK